MSTGEPVDAGLCFTRALRCLLEVFKLHSSRGSDLLHTCVTVCLLTHLPVGIGKPDLCLFFFLIALFY